MKNDLISRNSMRTNVALYMTENAYLNDTALDVLKMIDKWLMEAPAVDAAEAVRKPALTQKQREELLMQAGVLCGLTYCVDRRTMDGIEGVVKSLIKLVKEDTDGRRGPDECAE